MKLITAICTSLLLSGCLMNEREFFTNATGMPAPVSATVEQSDDDRLWNGNGETYVVYSVSKEEIDALLATNAPWDQQWQKGPLPVEIAWHTGFGYEHTGVFQYDDEPVELEHDPHIKMIMESEDTFFAAKESCCDGMPWNTGYLIMIDTTHNKVWLSSWDI